MHSRVLFGDFLMQSLQLLCVVLTLDLQMRGFVGCEVWKGLYGLLFLFTLCCKLILTTNKTFRNPLYI